MNDKIRIGKLSLDGCSNYGNVLQSYALQNYLESLGTKVDCLWHMCGYLDHPITACPKWRKKEWLKFILNWHGFRNSTVTGQFGWETARMNAIYQFCNKFLHIRRTMLDLSEIEHEYDAFIVGSDQVWGPAMDKRLTEHMFLLFTDARKRISYAASISTSVIPLKKIDIYKESLKDMKYISVREPAGAKLLEGLLENKINVHIDPTLLLTTADWSQIEERPFWFKEYEHGYVLTYFLGSRQLAAEKVAHEAGLPIINLLDRENFDHYVTSPQEFLYLIHHAALIYTDSFHGTVFSIQFRRPFVVCDRIQKNMDKLTSRIESLLNMFGLEGRRGTIENKYRIANPLKMEYPTDIENVLERERDRSHEYLIEALQSLTINKVMDC